MKNQIPTGNSQLPSSRNIENCSNVSSYSGSAGDSLDYLNGMKFTTKDRNNDVYGGNCAIKWNGAWWYNACHYSNLNGKYLGKVYSDYKGVG
jgi:hypothetical protein